MNVPFLVAAAKQGYAAGQSAGRAFLHSHPIATLALAAAPHIRRAYRRRQANKGMS